MELFVLVSFWGGMIALVLNAFLIHSGDYSKISVVLLQAPFSIWAAWLLWA